MGTPPPKKSNLTTTLWSDGKILLVVARGGWGDVSSAWGWDIIMGRWVSQCQEPLGALVQRKDLQLPNRQDVN